jgi:hypothetical protein
LYKAAKLLRKKPDSRIEIRKVMTNAEEKQLISDMLKEQGKENEHDTKQNSTIREEDVCAIEGRGVQGEDEAISN